MSTWILYHRIADSESGLARKRLSECRLAEEIQFRNVDISEVAHKDLIQLLGDDRVPCLVVEGQTYVGFAGIERFLLDFIRRRN